MQHRHYHPWMYCVVLVLLASSCKQTPEAAAPAEAEPPAVQTPVTVTTISDSAIAEYIELNATASFLQKNFIKANANGYLQSNFTQPGQFVNKGQILFTIKTKEAESIGNAVNQLDSSFKFSGTNAIRAGGQGFITQLNHQAGDYVQDGEQLAIVSDMNSFAFLLDLPYELRPFMQNKKTVELVLPDGEKLLGTVSGSLPTVDPAAQTQSIFIKVHTSHSIPENLIAKVRVLKTLRTNTVSLPRAAVMTDETQSAFWIMKMTDSITAVKLPVTKGIETAGRVEILHPPLKKTDRILLTGQYGLGDSAKVKIVD